MTSTHADGLHTALQLEPREPLELLEHVRDAWARAGLGEPKEVVALDGEASGAGWSRAEHVVRARPVPNLRGVRVRLDKRARLQLLRSDVPGDPPEALLTFDVGFDDRAPDVRARLAIGLAVVEQLGRAGIVRSGTAERLGGHARAAPSPPCSPAMAHAQIVEPYAVASAYGSVDVLAAHGWHVESIGSRLLCVRARDAFLDREFVGETHAHQRALARLAPPFTTSYGGLEVSDETRSIHLAGAPTLVALRPSGSTEVTMTATLGADEHVNGWEIDRIAEWLRTGRDDHGLPIDRVRVVFGDPVTAARESRPLLDVGATVDSLT